VAVACLWATRATVSLSAPTQRVTLTLARWDSDCRGAPNGDCSAQVRAGHVDSGQRQTRFHHEHRRAAADRPPWDPQS
jgi:hypothetical protein